MEKGESPNSWFDKILIMRKSETLKGNACQPLRYWDSI